MTNGELSPDATRLVRAPLAAVAFWSAIALPLAYVPFLVAGIEGPRGLAVFLAVLALHLVALAAGRSHRRGGP